MTSGVRHSATSTPGIIYMAPSRAARLAIAKPMPREAPVMSRVLPWRDVWLVFAGSRFAILSVAAYALQKGHTRIRTIGESLAQQGLLRK